MPPVVFSIADNNNGFLTPEPPERNWGLDHVVHPNLARMQFEEEVVDEEEEEEDEGEKEIDEDLMLLMQDEEGNGPDPILDWEPPVEILISDNASPYESDVEDFWSKHPAIWPPA